MYVIKILGVSTDHLEFQMNTRARKILEMVKIDQLDIPKYESTKNRTHEDQLVALNAMKQNIFFFDIQQEEICKNGETTNDKKETSNESDCDMDTHGESESSGSEFIPDNTSSSTTEDESIEQSFVTVRPSTSDVRNDLDKGNSSQYYLNITPITNLGSTFNLKKNSL